MYEIGKLYYYNNQKVKLHAVWYENEQVFAAVSYVDLYRNHHTVVFANQLTNVSRIKKRANITIRFTIDNQLEVIFNQNLIIPEQEKVNYLQTSFDLMVENEEV